MIIVVVTINPNDTAKITTVKKSSKAFDIITEVSCVVPSFIAPKIPVPLARVSIYSLAVIFLAVPYKSFMQT